MSDMKYGHISTEKGALLVGEPVFVLRAKDDLAVETIGRYQLEAIHAGCSERFIETLDAVMDLFEEWRHDNPELCKRPD